MPSESAVRDVMQRDIVTLRPSSTFEEAADLLADRKIGAVPVVGDDGRLVGLLRDEDLLVTDSRLHVPTVVSVLGAQLVLPSSLKRFEHEVKQAVGATVADLMDTEYPTIAPDATIEDLATLMHERDVTHVPVVDDSGALVGIVARGDIVRFIAATT